MAATVNGIAIQEMTLRLTLSGAWEATLTADTTDATKIHGAATISLDGVNFIGTAAAEADAGGKTTARVVAGADGLGTELTPQSYTATTVRVVLADILRECGETLSSGADSATLGRTIEGWVRLRQTGKDAIKKLVEFIGGISWRAMPDGSIWLGPETWPEVTPDYVLVEETPTDSAVSVASESLGVLPGQTFRGSRINEAEYRLTGGSLRLMAKTGETRSELAKVLGGLIKGETQTDYFALYPARVVGQNADGTIEVKCDSPKMPGMSKLPIRHGLCGVTAIEVQTGARVLVGFEGAEPSKPYAALWSGDDKMTRTRITGVLEVGGDGAVALADPITSWAGDVTTAILAIAALLNAPGPVSGAPGAVTPVSPLTGEASEFLFSA